MSVAEPIVIPEQPVNSGDTIEYEGQSFVVGEHFAQGKDMKDRGFSHMMFSQKGAFGLVTVNENESDNHSQTNQEFVS